MLASRCLRFFLVALAGGAVAQVLLPADATSESTTIPSSLADDNASDSPPAAEGTPMPQLEAAAPDCTTTTPAPAAEAMITIASALPSTEPDPIIASPVSPDSPTTIEPNPFGAPTAAILAPANADLANLDPAVPLATAPVTTRSHANGLTLGVVNDNDATASVPTTLQTITRPSIPLYTVPGLAGGAPDVVLPAGTTGATRSGEGGGEAPTAAVTPTLAFPPTRHWVLPLAWSYGTENS